MRAEDEGSSLRFPVLKSGGLHFARHAPRFRASVVFQFCRPAKPSRSLDSTSFARRLRFLVKLSSARKHKCTIAGDFNADITTPAIYRQHARQNLRLISPLSPRCRLRSNAAGNNCPTSRNRVPRGKNSGRNKASTRIAGRKVDIILVE